MNAYLSPTDGHEQPTIHYFDPWLRNKGPHSITQNLHDFEKKTQSMHYSYCLIHKLKPAAPQIIIQKLKQQFKKEQSNSQP